MVLASCSPDPAARRAALMEQFSDLANEETSLINEEAAEAYLSAANQMADDFPNDTLAALPLYRAAEVAKAIGQPEAALQCYQKVRAQYPDFHKAAEALFMLAFTYDEDLNDLQRAQQTYETFIATYPDHGFADDAEMLLSHLGKTDEEILRELEAQLLEAEATEAPTEE